ncbi:GD12765 [Drosophila simulans]|uniref:GD12765 n=1 Tax=Drosophila simulans TaxID=7240 RepID=B4QQP5_DROSI|nr:GD12765 [Drosophila simulans]
MNGRTDGQMYGQPNGRTPIPAGVLVPMSSQPDIACRMMYDIFAPHKQLCSTHGNKVLAALLAQQLVAHLRNAAGRTERTGRTQDYSSGIPTPHISPSGN